MGRRSGISEALPCWKSGGETAAVVMPFGVRPVPHIRRCGSAYGSGFIANLLPARYGARQREISIRTALGAGRARILCQFLTENLLMALVAGAIALLLARWGIDLLRNSGPQSLPRLQEVRLDSRVLPLRPRFRWGPRCCSD